VSHVITEMLGKRMNRVGDLKLGLRLALKFLELSACVVKVYVL